MAKFNNTTTSFALAAIAAAALAGPVNADPVFPPAHISDSAVFAKPAAATLTNPVASTVFPPAHVDNSAEFAPAGSAAPVAGGSYYRPQLAGRVDITVPTTVWLAANFDADPWYLAAN